MSIHQCFAARAFSSNNCWQKSFRPDHLKGFYWNLCSCLQKCFDFRSETSIFITSVSDPLCEFWVLGECRRNLILFNSYFSKAFTNLKKVSFIYLKYCYSSNVLNDYRINGKKFWLKINNTDYDWLMINTQRKLLFWLTVPNYPYIFIHR